MKQVKFPVAAIAAGVLLASCGSDDGNSAGNPDTGLFSNNQVTTTGLVADGYLNNATVCLDLNSNAQCDSNEPSATSGGNTAGQFVIESTEGQLSSYLLAVATAGTTVDTDTNEAIDKDFILKAPAGYTFVSPITTLVQQLIEGGMTLADAEAQVQSQLGTTVALSTDYIAAGNDEGDRLHLIAQGLTEVIAKNFEDFQDNPAVTGTDSEIMNAVLESLVSDSDTVSDLVAAVAVDGFDAEEFGRNIELDPADLIPDDVAVLSGVISSDMTLTADKTWILDGVVTVGAGNVTVSSTADVDAIKAAGVTLTIEPGTDIRATDDGTLLVTRGSKLMAEGTADAPITFSSQDDGYDGLGEWGGVVVQGFAPQFGAGGTGACHIVNDVDVEFCNVEGEGGTEVAVYGGNSEDDSSGVIKYVRIAEGGLVAGPNNEVNGLTLQGVGHGTTVEYVHVHNNLDDGIEWFGGTVNAKYVVLTNNDDDSLDYDEGYQGNIQYAIIKMDETASAPQGSNDPRGIEANSSDGDFVQETNAVVANALILGGQINDGQPGMRLRGALTTQVYNTAVRDFARSCVRVDDADIDGAGTTLPANVTLTNVIGDCDAGFYHSDYSAEITAGTLVEVGNVGASTITLDDSFAILEVEAQLAEDVAITAIDNGSGFTFDSTDYIGAVAPGTASADAWWAGWTIPGALGETSSSPFPDFVDCSADDCTVTATVSGTITEDFTFTANLQWIMDGVVKVGQGNVTVSSVADEEAIKAAGVTLTIEAGTDVRATDDGTLLVTRGSKLMAEGTASAPITFSSLDDGYDGLGEWGGVVVQGFAPQFGAGGTGACHIVNDVDVEFCNVEGEGGTSVAVYGGNDADDDSGVIKYVRIAEGGLVAGPNNEVNGLTLQGVGHGTTVEYVHVHNNLDDGIEWFGGTVNAKYVVLTNNDDDSLDYDEGYQGNIQYAIIKMDENAEAPQGSNDPRGIEANSSDADFVEETNAVVANALILGAQINDGQPGMRLRGALTTQVYNTAVRDFARSCVRVDDADIDGAGTTLPANVTLTNVIGDCESGFYHSDYSAEITAGTLVEVGNVGASTITLSDSFGIEEVAAQLSAAVSITAVDNGSGFVFDSTDYIGAVAPGTSQSQAWWSGWTIPGALGEDVGGAFPDFVDCSQDGCTETATISGTIAESYTLTSNLQWILDGVVRVGQGNVTVASTADEDAIKAAGVTLTIEAGTDVRATDDGTLLVTRGSKLMAEGTAAAPITFSSLDDGYDGLGEWGGVVVQGFAPQFGAGGTGACHIVNDTDVEFCNVEGEGGTDVAVYGGNDADDDSGVIKYVRIAEGGLVAGPNNEVNGLTLQGVGYGTTVEYVQVHNNLDDGIEWFGGTVNAKYVVLTNNDDDSLDYDEGYQGNIQYAIIKMDADAAAPQGSNDPRGIEANSSDADFVQETNAVVANALILGGQINDGQPGMRLRGALTTQVYNTAVRDFARSCVRVDDADIDGAGTTLPANVTLTNVIGDCESGFYHSDYSAEITAGTLVEVGTVGASDITLSASFAVQEVAAQLSEEVAITAVDNGSGFTFDSTDFIGAVAPGTASADAWWAGWTIPGSLGEDDVTGVFPDFVDCSADNCTETATISGTIAQPYTLTSDLQWILDGVVRVGQGNVTVSSTADVDAIRAAGVTLTVEAGTDVRAKDDGTLLVTRGSKLLAVGTATDPITFSSEDDNYDGLGEWGGVVIQGFAPQFGAGGTGACHIVNDVDVEFCNVEGEGGTDVAVYGGNIEDDDSGELRYVRITEGGLVAGPNNEVNGLTLQGVGHGTQLSYIQVHNNLDDGIEWFGGTVDLKYAVLTNNDDDSLDYDEGYQGNVQFAIIQMAQGAGVAPQGSNDPRGVEANSSDGDFVEETNATLANLTIVGGDINAGQPGMRLRGALTTAVYNTAIEGFDRSCVRVDDADIDGAGTTLPANVELVNVLGDCMSGYYHSDYSDEIVAGTLGETGNVGAEVVTFDDAYAVNEIQAQLDSAVAIAKVDNGGTFEFVNTDYVGAVAPGTLADDAWWAGWTIPGSLDKAMTAVDDSPSFVNCITTDECQISGTIDEDYTMVAGVEWSIEGTVTVGNGNTVTVTDAASVQAVIDAGVTLTIEAGVDVSANANGKLIVTRGSKLMARGEADEPITFSSNDFGFDGLGEWGGVVVQGFAPQYGAGGTGACFVVADVDTGVCNVEGEGGTDIGVYGGNDETDNSGVIRYVRIAEGGLVAGPNNEVNGLTLQGVGSATDIQYVQVHNNQDDGIEWFGGTVNVKYAVLTNNDDDSLDYDEGYQGNIQYAIIKMDADATAPQGSNDPRGIEANSSDGDFVQETSAVVSNVLIIGGEINDGQPGMRLRGALTTQVYNTAVRDFARSCVRVDDADIDGTGQNNLAANVTLTNVIGDCESGFYHSDYSSEITAGTLVEAGTVGASDVELADNFSILDTEAQLDSAVSITPIDNGSDFEFDATDFIGAVKPGSTRSWVDGWVIEGSLN